jgi:hypothetical protein
MNALFNFMVVQLMCLPESNPSRPQISEITDDSDAATDYSQARLAAA